MKCMECPDYKDCRRKNDLRRKRGKCAKAKDNYVPTNADRVRAMTDEELAEWIVSSRKYPICDAYCAKRSITTPCNGECDKGVLNWLQQPVKEGADQ